MAGIHGTVSLFDNQIPELWEEFHRFNKKYLKTAGALFNKGVSFILILKEF